MKHLGISGGGTKIAGLYGAARTLLLDKGYQPDIISGISAGAVLSVPLALGLHDEVTQRLLRFGLHDFFNVPPVNRKGKVRLLNAIWRLIRGKNSIGEQINLERSLSEVVTPERFAQYCAGNYPICIVGAVDYYTGRRVYVNLKEQSYGSYLKLVNASANIPIFTSGISLPDQTTLRDFEGQIIRGPLLLYDGGVRDHSPSAKVLESNRYPITETCTIFSRPQDFQIVLEEKQPQDLVKTLLRIIAVMNTEISKNDEAQEAQICREKGIRQHPTLYLPWIMDGVYDISPEKLRQLYEAGRTAAAAHWPGA